MIDLINHCVFLWVPVRSCVFASSNQTIKQSNQSLNLCLETVNSPKCIRWTDG